MLRYAFGTDKGTASEEVVCVYVLPSRLVIIIVFFILTIDRGREDGKG